MMADMRNPIRNNGSVNTNSVNHDAIDQDTYDADNTDLSSDKEVTIAASGISSSEDSGTQTQMPYEFEEGVNGLGA